MPREFVILMLIYESINMDWIHVAVAFFVNLLQSLSLHKQTVLFDKSLRVLTFRKNAYILRNHSDLRVLVLVRDPWPSRPIFVKLGIKAVPQWFCCHRSYCSSTGGRGGGGGGGCNRSGPVLRQRGLVGWNVCRCSFVNDNAPGRLPPGTYWYRSEDFLAPATDGKVTEPAYSACDCEAVQTA
jgi:hypothetical protein